MKSVLAAVTVLALGLAGAGCKRSPSLVGKWAGTMQGMAGTFEFAADDKMTISVTTPGGQINLLGDYKVVKDEATLNLTDVQVPGQNAQRTGMVKGSLASVLNKPTTMKITFVSEDEVSLSEKKLPTPKPATSPIGAMTLKRVKES
ncbi:hypothetical protein EON82_00570 [bacterium]|nr:MAG: hypothetical protein EON82_00570 [bacterium]